MADSHTETLQALLAGWLDLSALDGAEVTAAADQLVSLGVARREIIPRSESGNAISPSTLSRWIHRGCAGVKLKPVRAGGKCRVSARILAKFFDDVDAAKRQRKTRIRTGTAEPGERSGETMRQLQDAGLL